MKLILWILENFGALVVFQATNYFFGIKPAIISALIIALTQIAWLKISKRSISPFMVFTFIIVFIFGGIDLFLKDSVFFKFEPVLINLIIAGYFAISLCRKKSIIEELAEQQGRIGADSSPDKTFFFRFLTYIWISYFVLKAITYAWVAFNSSVQNAFVFRVILGTASFYILLGISLGLSRQIWDILFKLRLMPSTRKSQI